MGRAARDANGYGFPVGIEIFAEEREYIFYTIFRNDGIRVSLIFFSGNALDAKPIKTLFRLVWRLSKRQVLHDLRMP